MEDFKLTEQQRRSMHDIHKLTQSRRPQIQSIEKGLHSQYDQVMEQVEYQCRYCKLKCKGKQIGAHFRNEKKCKYMKDRPWLKHLPFNWREDLEAFQNSDSLSY